MSKMIFPYFVNINGKANTKCTDYADLKLLFNLLLAYALINRKSYNVNKISVIY